MIDSYFKNEIKRINKLSLIDVKYRNGPLKTYQRSLTKILLVP